MKKLVFIFLLLFPTVCFSVGIPTNTEFYSFELVGAGTTTVYTPVADQKNIVYAVGIQQEKSLSETAVWCGSCKLAMTYVENYPQTVVGKDCGNNEVYIEKTGADEAYVAILMLHEDPISAGRYTGATMQEWLFISMIFLFIISFVFWKNIFPKKLW